MSNEIRDSIIKKNYIKAIDFIANSKFYGEDVDVTDLEEVIGVLYFAYENLKVTGGASYFERMGRIKDADKDKGS